MLLRSFWMLSLATSALTNKRPDTLSLEAELEPLNRTHVRVLLQNKYVHPISILGWNNHFQNSRNGAHGSFKVLYQDSNGTAQVVRPAQNRRNFQFLKPVQSHFTDLAGRGWYSSIFDITELFEIPRLGNYNVSMGFSTRAILQSNNTNMTREFITSGKSVEGLPRLVVTSKSEIVRLNASLPHKTLRGRSNLGPCAENHKLMPVVLRARENARNLAKYAQNAHDPALWTEYFNDSAIELRVKRVYQGIINYGRNGNYYGITEYCDPNNEDPECTDDEQILAYRNPYQAGINSTTITLCAHFMFLQQQITCNYPSRTNPSMVDQGGLFLHELTHARDLVGYADISDGVHADCYSWDCIREAVVGDNDEIPPWHIGRAYELYAYAARALGTQSCHVNVALVDNNLPALPPTSNQSLISLLPPSTSINAQLKFEQMAPTSSTRLIGIASSSPAPNKNELQTIQEGYVAEIPQEVAKGPEKDNGGCLAC